MKKYYILPLIGAVLMLPAAVSAQSMDGEFEQIDANGDGYISAEELDVSQRDTLDEQNSKTMSMLDKNGDGSVSMSEYTEFYSSISKEKSKQELESNFKALDTNNDGELDVEELKSFRESTFDTTNQTIIDSLDTDKDGKISREEFEAFVKSMKIMFEEQ